MKLHFSLLLLLIACSSLRAVFVNYEHFFWQSVRDGEGIPMDREGTVYGNFGGFEIYFAGGVNLMYPNRTAFTAFTDIYTYNTDTNTYVRAWTSLPGPTYFGTGGFSNRKLYIYSGCTSTVANQPYTYFSDVYAIDFSNGIVSPAVTTLTLNPPVTPRMYASSFVASSGLIYVFGGAAGDQAQTTPNEIFFTININTGGTRVLPCIDDLNCPAYSVINPVIFMNQGETKFYVYSGMHIDYATFSNHYLYVYDIASGTWETPHRVTDGPNAVYNGWAVNSDVTNILLIGGDDGYATGSVQTSWFWDLTTDPPALHPIDAPLPYRCESPMVGVDSHGAVWVFSGSVYDSSASSNPITYNHGMLQLTGPPEHMATEAAYLLNAVVAIAIIAVIVAVVGYVYYRNRANMKVNEYTGI
jgi:hypothetical protein